MVCKKSLQYGFPDSNISQFICRRNWLWKSKCTYRCIATTVDEVGTVDTVTAGTAVDKTTIDRIRIAAMYLLLKDNFIHM